MSYILDALRRADAERERSAAPGLNTHHLDARGPDDDAADEPQRRAWPIAIGAIVALGAALAWSLFGREPAPPAAPPIPMAVEHPAEHAPAPPAAAMPAPPPAPVPATPPAVVTRLPPIPPPAPPAERPAPVRAAITVAAPPTQTAAATASAAAVASAKPAPAASAAAPEPRIPAQAELPDELRREIPPLVVGGAMYSPTPANRMLILNGQVAHEGDQPAPGLVLEQINLKTAVLRYKGQRFRIAY